MENEGTKYIDGNADDFTIFLFSKEPQEKNSIKLELSKPKEDIKIGLHIFQELLMIFTSGMKYLFGNGEETVSISKLSIDDITIINKYLASIGFIVIIEIFTIAEYLSNMKLPNYFKNKELIKDDTLLKDIYHEVVVDNQIIRVSFNFLS
jgi:hypothetical protein|tara:strand:+ start:910 stop:1359 length:450 start_codon:yes stop_codon:yes gene_type:complete